MVRVLEKGNQIKDHRVVSCAQIHEVLAKGTFSSKEEDKSSAFRLDLLLLSYDISDLLLETKCSHRVHESSSNELRLNFSIVKDNDLALVFNDKVRPSPIGESHFLPNELFVDCATNSFDDPATFGTQWSLMLRLTFLGLCCQYRPVQLLHRCKQDLNQELLLFQMTAVKLVVTA